MKILGIETSCDETGAAVVENGINILSNIVATSVEMHAKTGGIIPEIAAREQVRCIIPVIEEAIQRSGYRVQDLDALAVTIGPGLIGSLLVGVETAKTLAYLWNKPIIPVNHLIAHIYANWLDTDSIVRQPNKLTTGPELPAIILIVSGGHTELILMKNQENLEWIGGTKDDAAGECFDKSARLLGLPYPGGPAISAEAEKFKMQSAKCKIELPRPMINEKNFDFSFSGLKTAVLYETRKLQDQQQWNNGTTRLPARQVEQLSHELQEAITDVLVDKTVRAAEKFHVKSIILAGGVSANSRLREKFKVQSSEFKVHVPSPKLCTDNAVAIAACAFFNNYPKPWQEIAANPGLSIMDKI